MMGWVATYHNSRWKGFTMCIGISHQYWTLLLGGHQRLLPRTKMAEPNLFSLIYTEQQDLKINCCCEVEFNMLSKSLILIRSFLKLYFDWSPIYMNPIIFNPFQSLLHPEAKRLCQGRQLVPNHGSLMTIYSSAVNLTWQSQPSHVDVDSVVVQRDAEETSNEVE